MPLLSYMSWARDSLNGPQPVSVPLGIPGMQRSEVWGPDRIIRVWRSVLEGMPLGAFYLMNPVVPPSDGYDLLDGQQRTRALVLGMAPLDGQAEHRCLWVAASDDGGLDVFLTTRGQPFGYDRHGRRLGVGERREARLRWAETEWAKATGLEKPDHELFHAEGGPPPPAKADAPGRAVQLHRIIQAWCDGARTEAELAAALDGRTDALLIARLVVAMQNLHAGSVALIRVAAPQNEPKSGDWHLRLFGRIGTAGVPLSAAEQRFSIFKHHRPGSRAATDLIAAQSGRLMAPPAIMSMALRIARAQAGKPSWWPLEPEAFSQAMESKKQEDEALRTCLDELLGSNNSPSLLPVLQYVHAALRDEGNKPGFGLPATMVVQLSTEAKEVLTYWRYRHGATSDPNARCDLIRFALAWELCVRDRPRAVVEAFKFLRDPQDGKSAGFPLLGLLQRLGILKPRVGHGPERTVALALFPPGHLEDAFSPSTAADWNPWDDCINRMQAGEPSRELYFAWRGARGRLIAWLQRNYLHTVLHPLGPDVGHEDDWPLDLDHLQPQSSFDFDWRHRDQRLPDAVNGQTRDARWAIGNAVGNFAWLISADNRSLGNTEVGKKIGCAPGSPLQPWMERVFDKHATSDWASFSAAAEAQWTLDRMRAFQHAVESRTLWLYRRFWDEAGFQQLWDQAETATAPSA